MLRLVFPPKCIMCRGLLGKEETDLCHSCRSKLTEFKKSKRNIPFIAQWTAMWYHKDEARKSIHRFKFGGARNYADAYARLMAVKLQDRLPEGIQLVTWVPISPLRKFSRGYDQSALLAKALGKELGIPAIATLKKIHHTPPQSGIRDAAQRRANVLGAYKVIHLSSVAGKRILLIDDVVTTGATCSECAKMLLTAGAKEVIFAAVAAASSDKSNN